MTIKITRQDIRDIQKTDSLWLKEFAHNIDKKANNVDYLKDYLTKLKLVKQFDSIDEKLADIRSRVGLDLAIKISNETELNQKSASEDCCKPINNACACEIKTASLHADRDVQLMGNILKYIQDMISHEPNVDAAVVFSRCKQEEDLGFTELEKKIDQSKLMSYIKDLIHEKNPNSEFAKYTPMNVDREFDVDDKVAEYYNHAEPNHY